MSDCHGRNHQKEQMLSWPMQAIASCLVNPMSAHNLHVLEGARALYVTLV